ncbi:hypothetical protein OF83DRAFT_1050374 [Amylostereum chailletii]|nr:hypothetical protein OF83DRAFT_1050374 [Amylostereum chailletii]
MSSSTITRAQFQLACKAFANQHRHDPSDLKYAGLSGWLWSEHPTYPALGYLSRRVLVYLRAASSPAEEDDLVDNELDADDLASVSLNSEAYVCVQSVAFSPTFQVPVFYFTIHSPQGAPLSLVEVMRTDMLYQDRLPETDVTSFGLKAPESPFPLLSQGDHPGLGTPSWYIHPCGIPGAMEEITSAIASEGGFGQQTEGEQLVRWLEAWFMVLGTVVDLRT